MAVGGGQPGGGGGVCEMRPTAGGEGPLMDGVCVEGGSQEFAVGYAKYLKKFEANMQFNG